MSKTNCWEYKQCGREKGGKNSILLGVCPVYESVKTNGMNNGFNGGRTCWGIAGTMSDGVIQGSFAQKLNHCMYCEFYLKVIEEEGKEFQSSEKILRKIQNIK